jgi:DNA-binding MarR family transcriptional regulator
MQDRRAEEGHREHVVALLHRLRQRTDADLASKLDGVPGMRGSFGAILGVLPADGARPTVLAERLGITKQSLGERLRELEQRGWIESVPDPTDGRALIVRRTADGDRIREITGLAIASMESEWAAEVGDRRFRTFLAVLSELGERSMPTRQAEGAASPGETRVR